MGLRYTADSYDVLTNNCNHFTDELIKILTAGRHSIPKYLNRMAYIGSFFHCLVPQRYLNVTPEPPTTESGNVISEVNQSSSASSYALLCNANVLEWTNVGGSGTDDYE